MLHPKQDLQVGVFLFADSDKFIRINAREEWLLQKIAV